MINGLFRNERLLSTTADATTVANGIKMEIMPTWPIQVLKWGGVVTTAITTNPLQLRVNFRPTAGSAAGEVQGATASGIDTAGGAISLSTALGVVGRAFQHIVRQAPIVASVVGAVGGGLLVLPGQSVTMEAFGAAPAAGAVAYSMEYIELPVPGGLSALATVAGGARGTLISI